MTSYTRKLHDIDPAAAKAIHRQVTRSLPNTLVYGKQTMLVQFAPSAGRRVYPKIEATYDDDVSETFDRWADRNFRLPRR